MNIKPFMSDVNFVTGKKSSRDPSLDFIRGFAVILMILAHAVYFFHNGTNNFLNIFERTGNTITFTLFLFTSGAATFFAYIRSGKKADSDERKKILHRCLILLSGYYSVAIISALSSLTEFRFDNVISAIGNVLIFRTVPSFAEFLLPFVIFAFSIIFLKPLYHRLSASAVTAAIAGLSIYLMAYVIYLTPFPSFLTPYKALLTGEEGVLRFPVLQYFPVFTAGLAWGKILAEKNSGTNIKLRAFLWGTFYALSALVFSILSTFYNLPLLDPANRWPPSLGFLSVGLAAVYFTFIIFTLLPVGRILRHLWQMVNYFGQDSYDLYIVHVIILFFYRMLVGKTFSDPLTVLIMFAGLFVTSVAISSLNWNVSPSVYRYGKISFGIYGKYRFRKRYVLSAALVMLLLTVYVINGKPSVSVYGNTITKDSLLKQTQQNTQLQYTDNAGWYDPDYRFRKQLSVRNFETVDALKQNETVSLNTKETETSGMEILPQSETDPLVVYRSDTGFRTVPYLYNGTDRIISFSLVSPILPGQVDKNYYLYYGSELSGSQSGVISPATTKKYQIISGKITENKYFFSADKNWYLISYPVQMTVHLRQTSGQIPDQIKYEILDLKTGTELSSGKTHNGSVDISTLPVGRYTIRLILSSAAPLLYSNRIAINISQPVYVAWTLDWEGWDVKSDVYAKLNELSDKHDRIPFTDFINPRIYLPDVIPVQNLDTFKNWIISRKKDYGDATDLHLHMQYDFVKAAGVTPRKTPNWGYINGEGYDVYLTAYTREEISRMVALGKKLFAENGLGDPLGFRAGGWFADAQVLGVLSDYGFSFDSSGREHEMWGGKIKSPWNLTDTAQPYYPSADDANSAVGGNKLNILEIPNNGGNTYEYPVDGLVKRLYDNYSGTPVDVKKSIVFISHPQWADKELPEADRIMSYIDNFRYDLNRGPVIYTTVDNIYGLWK